MAKIERRNLIMLILAAIGVILLIVAAVEKYIVTQPMVRIVTLDSYFMDYEVKDQKVYMKYYITIDSSFREDKTVKLTALFPDDVASGLLQNEALDAPGEYIIPAKSKIGYEIIFEGEAAESVAEPHEGNYKKIPKMEIEILSESS